MERYGRQASGGNGEEGPAGETQYETTSACGQESATRHIVMDQHHIEKHNMRPLTSAVGVLCTTWRNTI